MKSIRCGPSRCRITGSWAPAIGVSVDADDHIWIIHRSSATLAQSTRSRSRLKTGDCCAGAPPVLEFDQAGNLLRHWGGPGEGYEWPDSNHGIFIDYKGNVWIGGNGGPDSADPEIHQGRQVPDAGRQEGRAPQGGRGGRRRRRAGGRLCRRQQRSEMNFGRVAKIFVDQKENEAYIADGYLNKRVAVLDADTGKMKR